MIQTLGEMTAAMLPWMQVALTYDPREMERVMRTAQVQLHAAQTPLTPQQRTYIERSFDAQVAPAVIMEEINQLNRRNLTRNPS